MTLLEDVTSAKVAGLLQERQPTILDDTDEARARFAARLRGAAVEVLGLVGGNPPAGITRDLAAEAIAFQVASEIEFAEFPEQQAPGDDGRGGYLHERYVELLKRLKEILDDNDGVVPPGELPTRRRPGRSRARFPAPEEYPDPVVVRGRSRRC